MNIYSITIATASTKDYDDVCELFRGLDQHHADIAPERFSSSAVKTRSLEQYRSYMAGDDRVLFLAKIEASCVGFANLAIVDIPETGIHVSRRYAHLDNVFVVSGHRRMGVASLLLDASLEWCRERRIPKLELQVYNANGEALQSYRALGFREYLTKMELNVNA